MKFFIDTVITRDVSTEAQGALQLILNLALENVEFHTVFSFRELSNLTKFANRFFFQLLGSFLKDILVLAYS